MKIMSPWRVVQKKLKGKSLPHTHLDRFQRAHDVAPFTQCKRQ